ncbi:MAG: GGDEF domain-containing protein [Desulfobacterales bacterium CG23_combo_of_CG06-09_8_20_14_all_52_9]|nr:MAG: GGDEF domain-containing protein [Desulfobacterales bacterium CG23_combo_of_CG06-09_8_20_14_all_52_9]
MKKKDDTARPAIIHKLLLFSLCVGATFTITWIRLLTAPDLALSVFYLLPILVAVWHLGRVAGMLVSLCSALIWLWADLKVLDGFSNPYIPFINETFRLVVFLFVTFIAEKLKLALEDQKTLARSDSLTEVANRRGFSELVKREMEKARRNQTPVSVIYFDVDNFKTLNDRFGHAAGDRFLYEAADILKRNVRVVDVVARLGGDEFCVLLGETGEIAAMAISRKLKGLLMDLTESRRFPVTFSIGVATFEKMPQGVEDLLSAADALMYKAKKAGKNQICSAVLNPSGE